MELEINIKTKKINSNSEIIVDNNYGCFRKLILKQHFEEEENSIVVEIQMDVLNKQIEINGIGLSKAEIMIFQEFISQLKLNEI